MDADANSAEGLTLVDSVASVAEQHAGMVAVTGSHGGLSAARFALKVPLAGVVFNDAGVGKDGAGIAGLRLLDEHRLPAVAVAHWSARIGDAADTLRTGVVSHVNASAAHCGIEVGQSVREAASRMIDRPAGRP